MNGKMFSLARPEHRTTREYALDALDRALGGIDGDTRE